MKMKTTLGLLALCLLAITVAPTASAHTMYDPLVQGCADPGAGCGPNHNSWATVAYDALGIRGCISTQIGTFRC